MGDVCSKSPPGDCAFFGGSNEPTVKSICSSILDCSGREIILGAPE